MVPEETTIYGLRNSTKKTQGKPQGLNSTDCKLLWITYGSQVALAPKILKVIKHPAPDDIIFSDRWISCRNGQRCGVLVFSLSLNKQSSGRWSVTLIWHHCSDEGWYVGNHDGLTYWGRNKMATISKTTFTYVFSWMKFFQSKRISLKYA